MVREYFESVLQENGGQIAEYAAKIEEQQLELESVEKKIVKISPKKNLMWDIFHQEEAKIL